MALSPGQTMWIEGWDIARNEPSPRQVEIVRAAPGGATYKVRLQDGTEREIAEGELHRSREIATARSLETRRRILGNP